MGTALAQHRQDPVDLTEAYLLGVSQMQIFKACWFVGVIVLAAILGWIEPAQAQTEQPHTIQIGSHELAVGMEEAVVLRTLADDFDLQKVEETGSDSVWSIVEKTRPEFVVGLMTFGGDARLSTVTKAWGSDAGTAGELAQAIYRLATSLAYEGITTCQISTEQALEPAVESRTTLLSCGHKSMVIQVHTFMRPAFQIGTVDEVLSPGDTAW